MFNEIPRYIGFPNQCYCVTRFGFDSLFKTFNGKAPLFVSTYVFKNKTTPIVDSLIFDIDSYFSLRVPYENTKILKTFCDKHKIAYVISFSVNGDAPILAKVEGETKLIPITEVIDEFKKGKHVETLSYSKDGNVIFSPVYNYLEHDDKIYEIYHEQSNLPLKLTEHHSIYKWDDSEIIKVKKNNIKEGDYLVTFRNVKKQSIDSVKIKQKYSYRNQTTTEEIDITDDMLTLMGYYVAEGHTNKSGTVGFSFNAKEFEYHEEVTRLIHSLIPANLSSKNKIKVNESLPHESEKQILFCSQKFRPFFVEQCGSTQDKRHVPSFLFDMSKEKFILFLTSYLNGDGSYKGKYNVPAKTISKRLAIELTWLCKMHGISCYLSKGKNVERRKGWNVKRVYSISITKKDLYNREKNNKFHPETRDKLLPIDALKKVYYQCKPKYFNYHKKEQMTLSKQRASSERILRVIKWFDETKSEDYSEDSKRIISNYKMFVEKGDIGFLKIKKVTETSNKLSKVYDISVVDSENFFCGDYPILHKNSGGKGFHFFMIFNPVTPETDEEKQKLKDKLYSTQQKIVEHLKIEAIDIPTIGRLRWLIRYPTSKYVRIKSGKVETNGFYCRNLTSDEFDSGLKHISELAKKPGEVPRKPSTNKTLDDIIRCLPKFKIRERRNGINIPSKGTIKTPPSIEALGLPCLKVIARNKHPNHHERIELVSFLKLMDYSDYAITSFLKTLNWLDFKWGITAYQVSTITPRYPKCSYLAKTYDKYCDKCTFGK